MRDNSFKIQIDDSVKLNKKSEKYKDWKGFIFRVITINESDEIVRIVRHMRVEELGATNHYLNEPIKNVDLHKKNKKYLQDEEEKKFLEDIDL